MRAAISSLWFKKIKVSSATSGVVSANGPSPEWVSSPQLLADNRFHAESPRSILGRVAASLIFSMSAKVCPGSGILKL